MNDAMSIVQVNEAFQDRFGDFADDGDVYGTMFPVNAVQRSVPSQFMFTAE
jgi:hypothetical protein